MRDSWRKVKIGDICETYAGGTPNRSNSHYYNGEIPWVSSGEVNQSFITKTKEKITTDGLRFSSAKMIPKEAILLAMYGATAGQVSKLKIEASSNQAVLALIPHEANDYFIYHELNYIKNRILFLAQGSGQPNLSKSSVDKTLIDFPPLPQQKKIAQILSTCDTVLEQTEAAIAKYQALKQGMLHDLFTRGIDIQTGQLRASYEDAPELYKETELGFVPLEWYKGEINDCIDLLKSGLSRLLSHQDIGIPVVISGNIQENKLDLKNLKYWYLNDPQGANTNNYLLEKGDILLCFINSIDQIGKLALFEGFHRPCIYTTNLFRIKSNDNYGSLFLYYLLLSNIVQKQIRSITKPAVNQASFTTKEFSSISVPLIPLQEQKLIEKRLKSIDQKIHIEQQTLAKYTQLKAGLMQDLLSGVVGVERLLNNQEN